MNWIELYNSPLWTGLWESDEVKSRITAIQNQLVSTHEIDAHTLGKLRGQLAMVREIQSLVEVKASQEENAARTRMIETGKTPSGWRPFQKVR